MKATKKSRIRTVLTALAVILVFASVSASPVPASARVTSSTSLWSGYREPLSEGVKNTLINALCMYNTFWTPLQDVSRWGTREVTYGKFVAGHTYRGIPYGQPVHKGVYIGTSRPVSDFISAVADPDSPLYATRGENTWYYTELGGDIKYSPYFSNDCSGFVSAALRIKRHTTSTIGSKPDMFPVIGTKVSDMRPGDLLNTHKNGHVIMVYDVVYSHRGGNVVSVVTIEQTPDIIVIRSFGKGGVNGSLQDLQNKINSGKYYVCRYKDIDNVELMDGAWDYLPSVVNCVSEPSSILKTDGTAEGKAYINFAEKSFRLEGWSLSHEKTVGFEYEVNGSGAKSLSSEYCSDITAPVFGFNYFDESSGRNRYYGNVEVSGLSLGDVIDVYAKTVSGRRKTASLIVEEEPYIHHFSSSIESLYTTVSQDNVNHAEVTVFQPLAINGWCAADNRIRFEIQVDDGLWYTVGPNFRSDVWDVVGWDYPTCRDCNAFYCGIDLGPLGGLNHTVTLRGVTADGGVFDVLLCKCTRFENQPLIIGIAAAVLAFVVLLAVLIPVLVVTAVKKKRLKQHCQNDTSEDNSSGTPAGNSFNDSTGNTPGTSEGNSSGTPEADLPGSGSDSV